ncbi:phage portal protein [Shinella sp. CPCC 101442]|uniref:phage portal protein n=1 Tax=Shinella sp. CPCC 101442 TaxID=2932265 RepID=UPI002153401A|nr:phage portal protein [Shinella sp. CPCC 101442]MCR6498424.1 phage portal protein [Shinella sp. CPCC 101442]
MDWKFGLGRPKAKEPAETRTTIENPTVPVSAENFLAFFGVQSANLPAVTIDNALTVPAVWAAVNFLSRTLAALPLHAYRKTKTGSERISGMLATVVHDAPNPAQDRFKFWHWFWSQVFTGGRGLAWIERTPQGVDAIWPLDPGKTTISRRAGKVFYTCDGIEYSAADVIDVPFMLKADGLKHYGPIAQASKAIQLALAMNDYGSNFFAGGGVPPLVLEGPLPANGDAMNRAKADIKRAIDGAKGAGESVFPIPPGYKLNPVGLDPAKGQMVEARRFQVEEIARAWQMPPVFLQDLSKATFSNAEQQDLHLVKHLIGQWAEALEGEMNLKLFGRTARSRYVEHNLDGLLRGDYKTRMEGNARAIMTAQLTPNEARELDNRPPLPGGEKLLIQQATVPVDMAGEVPASANDNTPVDGNEGEAEAA